MAGNNVAFALGLAQKAGKTASGDVAVRAALKAARSRYLFWHKMLPLIQKGNLFPGRDGRRAGH